MLDNIGNQIFLSLTEFNQFCHITLVCTTVVILKVAPKMICNWT